MISGWRVTRGFSKLGAIRGMLQRLSFEVALIILFLFILRFIKSFFLKKLPQSRSFFSLIRIMILFVSNRKESSPV
jgi:NADH:ubiquinone oxidoreductase subunit H